MSAPHDPYVDGYDAFLAGRPLASNPCPANSLSAWWWSAGWVTASQE